MSKKIDEIFRYRFQAFEKCSERNKGKIDSRFPNAENFLISSEQSFHLKLRRAFFPKCFEQCINIRSRLVNFIPEAVFAHESAIHASPAALLRYSPFTYAKPHYVVVFVKSKRINEFSEFFFL